MSDIRIENEGSGWHVAAQDAAYGEGSRVVHMDSGRIGTVSMSQENPITGRRHHVIEFDDGTRGVFQQRSLAPTGD
jgi:hypothetical protein